MNQEPEKNNEEKTYQDIPTTFFKPISEVQEQQEELVQNYNINQSSQVNNKEVVNKTVRIVEGSPKSKKYTMPLTGVLVIVILINLAWFIGVKLIIVPKYEEYVSQSEEIKSNYDTLKRQVDAIVGTD